MKARLLAALAVAVFASGCGVKSAYNNLDRLIAWGAKDFVDFDKTQMAYMRGELDSLLYWHRTTQLPLYAAGLRELEYDVRRGLDREALLEMEGRSRAWGETLIDASLPMVCELLYSLSDAQIEELEQGFADDNREWLEDYEGLDADARRKKWSEEFGDTFEFFSGRLTEPQRSIIERYSARWIPDDVSWLGYRERWQADVVKLIRARGSFEAFFLGFKDMATNRERWYGDDYRAAFEQNEEMYRVLTLELFAALGTEQLERLRDKLLDIAKDFEELAGEPRVEPPAVCLVTCVPETPSQFGS